MKEFGWTIEYVLSLSFPVFLNLMFLVNRVRADAAIDEVFKPYCAGKYGGKVYDRLFDDRGEFYLSEGDAAVSKPKRGYSRAMMVRTEKRLRSIIMKQEEEMAKAAISQL